MNTVTPAARIRRAHTAPRATPATKRLCGNAVHRGVECLGKLWRVEATATIAGGDLIVEFSQCALESLLLEMRFEPRQGFGLDLRIVTMLLVWRIIAKAPRITSPGICVGDLARAFPLAEWISATAARARELRHDAGQAR